MAEMVLCGRIPLAGERRLTLQDFSTIIQKSQLDWVCINNPQPFLKTTLKKKDRKVTVSIWEDGLLQIQGVTAKEEEEQGIYVQVVKELQSIV